MAYTTGSSRGNALEIGIALVLQDRFSNQAREASSVIKGLHRDAKMAVSANLNALQGVTNTVQKVANRGIDLIEGAVISGANFIDTMTTIGAITGATDEKMKTLANTAQSLGLATMFSSQDIASGMKYLAMAGNSVEQINDRIKGAAYVAAATGLELGGKGGAADMITNVMKAFRLEGEGVSEMVGDVLTKATLSANISMTDMAESIRYAVASMVSLKQGLPQVSAMIGTLGNAGIQGSMAGTAIDNMARYFNKSIINKNFSGNKVLTSLGFTTKDFTDANGNIIDFSYSLEKLKNRFQELNLSSTVTNDYITQIFGARGKRAAFALMNDIEGYRSLLRIIETESEGFSKKVSNTRMDSLAGGIDKMVSAFENLRTTFTESLAPVIGPIFNMVAKIVDRFRKLFSLPVIGPIISSVMTIGVALLGIGAAVMKLRVKWLILRNDSMVSGKTMFSLLMGGWDGARLKAERYLAIERAIIAQRNGGIGASIGGVMLGAGAVVGAGQGKNGVRINSAGKFIDAKTGRFVSQKVAMTATGTVTAAAATKALMGGTAKTAGMKGLGAGLLGKGGWVGTAIGLVLMFLPDLISALSSNTKAEEENTASVYTLAGRYETEAARIAALKDNDMHHEIRQLTNSLNYWTSRISSLASQKPQVNLTINNKGDITSTVDGDDVRLETGTR